MANKPILGLWQSDGLIILEWTELCPFGRPHTWDGNDSQDKGSFGAY